MKLAVSNIAWSNDEEEEIADLLVNLGVKYVEVAPTKLWQDPTKTSENELENYKRFWNQRGIEIIAFQSMLFNRPDLKIFEDEHLRASTLSYLKDFITLAPKLGAGVMVFGSPKNRQRGNMAVKEADKIAENFFNILGDAAIIHDVIFCIEPNPTNYACDYITNSREGIELVKKIANPGFGLHLDIAGMTLAEEDIASSIIDSRSYLKHFHISAPCLDKVYDRKDVNYRAAAKALKDIDYTNFVSIEMKPDTAGTDKKRVEDAVRFSQNIFID